MRRALLVLTPLLPLAPAAAQPNCSNVSIGLVPLPDLGPGLYMGYPGGLYPGGVNMRPAAHDLAGLMQAAQVVPRNAMGAPDPNGKIVLLSIGMSNASQEFTAFEPLASADPDVNPAVALVNGAQGGQTAQLIVNPAANFWNVIDQRLAQKGFTPMQVQAIWFKEANPNPTGGFPSYALTLANQFVTILGIVRANYPNARLAYCSSRIYGGYASVTLNPEPYAYESGFAVKWTIESQILGNPALNYDSAAGPVVAPWLSWGPYLWADGLDSRSDGLSWTCANFAPDGTHPVGSGQAKVANLLLDFFKTDATAKSWFLANPSPTCGGRAEQQEYGVEHGGPNGASQLVASRLPTVPTLAPFRVHAFDAPASSLATFLVGFFPLSPGVVPLFGGWLQVVPAYAYPRITSSNGKADLDFGTLPFDPVLCGGEVYFQFAAADPSSPGGVDVSRGLRARLGH